ncbi:uncharacterized protein LOC101743392 isoform X1 [Bombyx mori]|uniref:Uncharacterized protein n=1 Tax=Bombyx mori TaxID=7091 RepID=A0A8R2C5N6_BOMMO|nr:uncharacterized protein LOC101743392 isoform X1 [Bombyx mori]
MLLIFSLCCLFVKATAQDYYYTPNVSRSTIPGIAAYRSALTLDWLAAEDSRQREMVAAFETEQAPPMRMILTDCMGYATPPSEKIARLLLELLKNLEGDEGPIILDLTQALIRAKLLIETSTLESEPDLESLVKTPNVMMGEPHKTFPRILAAVWLTLTDASTTTKYGWCPINKVTKYLTTNKPVNIAEHMRSLDPVLARARFVMEEFVQHVTPLNMYQKLIGRRKEVSFGQKQQKHGPKENPKIERAGPIPAAKTVTTKLKVTRKFDTNDGSQIVVANIGHSSATVSDLLNIFFLMFIFTFGIM